MTSSSLFALANQNSRYLFPALTAQHVLKPKFRNESTAKAQNGSGLSENHGVDPEQISLKLAEW